MILGEGRVASFFALCFVHGSFDGIFFESGFESPTEQKSGVRKTSAASAVKIFRLVAGRSPQCCSSSLADPGLATLSLNYLAGSLGIKCRRRE